VAKGTFRPPYRRRVTRYVYIPLRDGARLAADIYRPASDGRFPCLLVRTPYNKNHFSREEADRYVRRGYVLCVVDARGTGGSEGEFRYYNIPEGLGDGADVVNWLAEQPFSDGQVGTFGGSALGAYQLLTAREKPAALRAMFVEVAPVDFYQDNWFPGGVFLMGARVGWVESMTTNIAPAAALQDVEGDLDPEGEQLRRQVSLGRLRLRHQRALAGHCPTPQEWFVEMRAHPERDDFWSGYDLRPVVRECDIPTYYRGVWYDHFVRGTCESYVLHRGPKRLVVGPGQQGTHGPHADLDVHQERLRWFDHWLKGLDTGVMDQPPVTLFVMGEERWRTFEDWPVRCRAKQLALSADGALTEPEEARPFEHRYVHDPEDPVPSVADVQDIREFEQRALTYTTAPLTSGLTVVGEPTVELFLRSSAPDTQVIVKLADVFPDGRSRQVTFGRLRASHREGHHQALPLAKGRAVRLTIPLWPVANTFLAGHRIRLVVAGSDAPYSETRPEPAENSLLGSADELPVLTLPETSPADWTC